MPLANKFPPKFSQKILYPAIYNLDEYDMPQSNHVPGVYFDIQFPNYGINSTPLLTYGKHKFEINLKSIAQEYNIQGYPVGNALPKLKKGSRILFELKDSGGTVIFSDNTPLFKQDGFTAYIWLKEDPLRTYNNIEEGYGILTIVAKAKNLDPNWRNKYNIRTTMNVYISLGNGSGLNYINESPIVLQRSSASIGSGSGLVVSESLEESELGSGKYLSYLNISSSKLRTYSGVINLVRTYIKVSGSTGIDPEWEFFQDHPLTSSMFEDNIYKAYGWGINTLSETWKSEISTNFIQRQDPDQNFVKFKLEFINPMGDTARDYNSTDAVQPNFVLQYPNLSDSNIKGWLQFQGSDIIESSEVETPAESSAEWGSGAGQFSLHSDFNSIVLANGSQRFDSEGNMTSFDDGKPDHSNDPYREPQ